MALQTITEINLDINQPGIAVVHAKQYDTVRQVKAHLFYGGVKWLVPSSNITSVVGFKKADRIGGFYDETEDRITAITVDASDRSIIYITLDRNVLTTPGNVNTEITFYDSITTGRLSTFSFITQVEQATVVELDLASNPYFNVLAQDIKTVIEAAQSMTGLTATATKLAPDAEPTVQVTGGTSAQDPYVFHMGLPSMPGITTTATGISSASQPYANITGGQTPGQDYNIAFGIPHGAGISSMVAKYGASANDTTIPSSWVNTITELTIPDGYVLWVWIRVTYEDSTTYDYYSKAAQGYPGPPGVAVQTTEPDTTVKVWINPNDTQTIVIPEVDDSTIAQDSSYSSYKIRNSFLAFDATQTLSETQQIQAYSNLGLPSNTLGKLGYVVVT